MRVWLSLGRFRVVVVVSSLSRGRVVRVVVAVDDSLGLVPEVSELVVASPGRPMSVVDSRGLVGKVEVSDDGVRMNGSVVRNVCCVVAMVVITVGVEGWLHWSDIRTTVSTSAAIRTMAAPPAVKMTAELRYQGSLPGSDISGHGRRY